MSGAFVLPGERIPETALPGPSERPIRLGPGVRQAVHKDESGLNVDLVATSAGPLIVDYKKRAVWVENGHGRTNDQVLVTVHHSSADTYLCSITPHTSFANLPQLAFEGATKKTRPQLASGSLVYARIAAASKQTEVELTCMNPASGKSDGLGPLTGGMVFGVSLGFARRLLMTKQREEGAIAVLDELAHKLAFEIAVGRNGRVWVTSRSGVPVVLLVGRILQQTDQQSLDVDAQVALVRKSLKALEQ